MESWLHERPASGDGKKATRCENNQPKRAGIRDTNLAGGSQQAQDCWEESRNWSIKDSLVLKKCDEVVVYVKKPYVPMNSRGSSVLPELARCFIRQLRNIHIT